MSAIAYVKLYTAVMHTGYHCHVAYNTVACIYFVTKENCWNDNVLIGYIPSFWLHALLNFS